MSIRSVKGEPTEATLSRRAARRLARDEKVKARRRGVLALGLITLGVFTGILATRGSGDDKEKLASGNTIEAVDRDKGIVEIGSVAVSSSPTYPEDDKSLEVGDSITVRCEGFHSSSNILEAGSNLSELVQQIGYMLPQPGNTTTQRWEPGISVQAIAEGIAAYNGINNGAGEISPSFAQPDTVYQVPQFCYIES